MGFNLMRAIFVAPWSTSRAAKLHLLDPSNRFLVSCWKISLRVIVRNKRSIGVVLFEKPSIIFKNHPCFVVSGVICSVSRWPYQNSIAPMSLILRDSWGCRYTRSSNWQEYQRLRGLVIRVQLLYILSYPAWKSCRATTFSPGRMKHWCYENPLKSWMWWVIASKRL